MSQFILSGQAKRDLHEIASYISQDSPGNAALFIEKLEKHFSLIASRPLIGRPRTELSSELRSISYGRYIIFYRALNDGIQIVRVLHGARKIEYVIKPN